MKTTTVRPKVGDKVLHFGMTATVSKIGKGLQKYEVSINSKNGIRTEWYSQKEFNKHFELLPPDPTDQEINEDDRAQLNLNFSNGTIGEFSCNNCEPVDCLKASADSVKPPVELEGLTGSSQSRLTTTPLKSCDRTLTIPSITETSETFSPDQANMTSLLGDSPVMARVELVAAKDCTINTLPCLENSSAASALPVPHSYSWSNLADLSIEDLELGLADSIWQDMQASIHCYSVLTKLERSIKETGYLSCPTLLSSAGNVRPAGTSKCEKWWKENVIKQPGLQLSGQAIALLQGFPENWFQSLLSPAQATPPADSKAESLQVVPLPSLKLALLLNGSNGCGLKTHDLDKVEDLLDLPLTKPQSKPKKHNANRKPATGSLAACVSVKKGKEYTSYQYNYDVRDETSKRGWRTVKVGVPKFKVKAVTDAIALGKTINEILIMLKG